MALIDENDKIIPVNEPSGMTKLVGQVAASYLGAQRVQGAAEISEVIASIAEALAKVDAKTAPAAPAASEGSTAAPKMTKAQWGKLVKPEGITSLIDNRSYKTLRRHLTTHGHTPESYREKFGLPAEFPMVAPSYSAARSAMAKQLGLGSRVSRKGTAPASAKAKAAPRAKKGGAAPAE